VKTHFEFEFGVSLEQNSYCKMGYAVGLEKLLGKWWIAEREGEEKEMFNFNCGL
jgi:hypothetical protein